LNFFEGKDFAVKKGSAFKYGVCHGFLIKIGQEGSSRPMIVQMQINLLGDLQGLTDS
jgi:hypothetical protein